MRRVLLLALGLGIFGAALGCNHTAGVCDCEGPGGCACEGGYGGSPAAALQAEPPMMMHDEVVGQPVYNAEPIHVAPRPVGNIVPE